MKVTDLDSWSNTLSFAQVSKRFHTKVSRRTVSVETIDTQNKLGFVYNKQKILQKQAFNQIYPLNCRETTVRCLEMSTTYILFLSIITN